MRISMGAFIPAAPFRQSRPGHRADRQRVQALLTDKHYPWGVYASTGQAYFVPWVPSNSERHVQCTPIGLTHTPARCRVIPVAGIKLGIGRRLCVASDAEQRTEGVERVEAPVEPKREFVEVGLYRSLTP